MKNRRNDYRHTFPPDERLEVRLLSHRSHAVCYGEIVDLSTMGMRVRLVDAKVPVPDEQLTASFVLPLPTGPLTIRSVVVYTLTIDEESSWGIHFLDSCDRETDQRREAALWQFLTEEQRKVLRGRRQSRAT